jgi:4'-phosphopantetheinyl transferase
MVPIAPDQIDVWTITMDDQADGPCDCLSISERARAVQFSRPEDGRRFAFVRSVLRQILARYLAIGPGAVRLHETAQGKPFLEPSRPDGLTFNLSHGARVALIAVGMQPHIGIDLEDCERQRDLEGITGLVFDAAEQRFIASLAPGARNAAILRGWTRKEAAAKAIGTGFLTEPKRFSVPLEAHGRWRIDTPGGLALDLIDLCDDTMVAALAADRIAGPPRRLAWPID